MNNRDRFSLGVRIANFSDLNLPGAHVLDVTSTNTASIVEMIRRYADLPYIFMVAPEHAKTACAVLAELKTIRSPCYPYALFSTSTAPLDIDDTDIDYQTIDSGDPDAARQQIDGYARERFRFDDRKLRVGRVAVPLSSVDVVIVGGGITGLYAADQLQRNGISFCLLEKDEKLGGIWSAYANTTSRVNTSEGAYRLIENKPRSNRDHSATREILEDLASLAKPLADHIFLQTEVKRIEKKGDRYRIRYLQGDRLSAIESKGVILAINDRVGSPRKIQWKNQDQFQGTIVSGISDGALSTDWHDKKVAVVGMGAFAVENARTALEGGARHVTVIGRRHGTICPKIIDYLNFATPYDDRFKHEKKSNIRNMMYWKKLYDLSGATQPECWMGKIKHSGHTISVSDIWFIGHYLKMIDTVAGTISELTTDGVVVDGQQRVDADIVVNCIGFERNGAMAKSLCGYEKTTNINFVDRNFMYLADAYIDDDAFNSFFGSSVLEMVKFYLDVFIKSFGNSRYDEWIQTEGVEWIPIDKRKWSSYIDGATALVDSHPDLYETARAQVDRRTENFLEKHDLETYIAENKREWIDTHAMLAGKPIKASDCLPYVFEKLLPS